MTAAPVRSNQSWQQIRTASDRATIDRENDITGNDAGLGRGAPSRGFGHQSSLNLLQAKSVGNIRGDGLDFDAERAPCDNAPFFELLNHRPDGRSWNSEPDTDRAT